MKSNSENKSMPMSFILLVSALSGVVASFLIGSTLLKIIFGLFIFLFNLTLLSLLLNRQIDRTFSVRAFTRNVYLYVVLGFIASVCILLIPNATVQLNVNSLLSTFASLAPLSYLRVISAFFLTGLFPGLIVYFIFMRNYDFNVAERIGLVLLISYCFTMISGLLLGLLQVFSTISYVLTFWLFATVLLGYRQIKLGKKAEVPVKVTSFSFDVNLLALVFAASALVILSYIQVLASAPMSGIVGGDVLDYMVAANRFAWSDFAGWSPYVWSNNFYLLIANLAGLPMHFIYVGLQFYLIIPVAAFYFLVRTIFPDYKKIAAIATLLCFFAAGVTSWLLLHQMLVSSGVFQGYMGSDNFFVLYYLLFQYTGASGITPFALSPWIFDFGFLFFALAFVYRAVFKKERKLVNYVLPAIFMVAAFFSHNFNIIFVFLFSLAILGLFMTGCRRYILKLSLLTLALALALDPLSKWMFVGTLFAAAIRLSAMQLGSGFFTYLFVIGAIAIGIAGLFALSYVKKRNLRFQFRWTSNPIERTKMVFSNNKAKLLFYIVGFIFFGAAVSLYLYHYLDPTYALSWTSSNYSFHWDWIVFRSYGIILPFALASIPFMVHKERNSLLFTSVVSIAIFVSTVISVSLPEIIPTYIGYSRYIAYLVIPLSILAAFGIYHSMHHLKKRRFKAFFVVVLVVLVSTSILSQVYVREMFFDLGQNPIISENTNGLPQSMNASDVWKDIVSSFNQNYPSNDTVLAINWINVNLTKGTTILPLSPYSEKILSNLVLGVKVAPNFQTWYLNGVLSNSTTEVVLNCLNTLRINYIFVDSRDSFYDPHFSSIIHSFPEVYRYNEEVIYSVPTESWSMPYFDSLFQKITFSLYEQYTGSTTMNNKVVWFGDMNAYGDVRVTSSNININLTGEKLAVASMSVITNNGNIVFENKTLSDVSINGVGEIMIGNARPVQFTNASNLNANVDLADSRNITLSFSGANINYKDGSSLSGYRNVDVIITLDSANSLVALCKQPNVTISGDYGSVSGKALGLAKGITFDTTRQVMLWGNFTVEIPFTDNLLYSQMTSTKELNVSWDK